MNVSAIEGHRSGHATPGTDHEFALLTYRTKNIGDYIQSIAAKRFLPRIEHTADRDQLNRFRPDRPTKLVCNGWFGRNPESIGFHENVRPLLISMHISQHGSDGPSCAEVVRNVAGVRAEIERFAPVGARDLVTLKFFRDLGIESYFSGCLTLTLDRDAALPRGEHIVACDVPMGVIGRLMQISDRQLTVVHHKPRASLSEAANFSYAERLLRLYQTAHVVVTTRLHCALPCVAYGTPVVFLQHGFEAERFVGLTDMMRTIPLKDGRHLTAADLESPAANSAKHLGLRAELIRRVTEFIENPRGGIGTAPNDQLATARASAHSYGGHNGGRQGKAGKMLRRLRRPIHTLKKLPSWWRQRAIGY